jgi:peptide/nickel transport system permease protein
VKEFVESPIAVVGLVVFLAIVLSAVFAPFISPQNPFDLGQIDIMDGRLPPGAESGDGKIVFHLGTDDQGRDMVSAILYGLRTSLMVGASSAILALALGTAVGLVAAYAGGAVDAIAMRVVDIQLSFPPVFLAIAIIAALGQSLTNMIVVLGLVSWVQYARVSRGTTLALRNQEFMLAARAIGADTGRILLRHLFPSVLPPLAVIATVNMSAMILNEAALSFLGLGVQPPTPAWGSMVSEARSIMRIAWWNAVFPGLAIALFVIGGNLMGDGLSRDK